MDFTANNFYKSFSTEDEKRLDRFLTGNSQQCKMPPYSSQFSQLVVSAPCVAELWVGCQGKDSSAPAVHFHSPPCAGTHSGFNSVTWGNWSHWKLL